MKMTKWMVTILAAMTLAGMGVAKAADTTNAAPKLDNMTTCPVSGEKLGEMGKPYVFDYQGQEVKLCCKSCKKDFDKDPAKYVKKVQAADKAPTK